MRNSLIVILLTSVLLVFSNCSNNQIEGNSAKMRGQLVVAMDVEMPGYFVIGGESYGYQYDLYKAYADYLGVELQVISNTATGKYSRMLNDGAIDIVTTLSANADNFPKSDAIEIYNTSYVLLGSKSSAERASKQKNFNLTEFIHGSRVLISSGFKTSRTYDELLDSMNTTNIVVSSRSSFELMESLSSGEYDFLICEMSEAQLGCALVRNVDQIYEFSDKVSLSSVVSDRNKVLKEDFEQWFETFHNSDEYAVLNDLYFERGIVRQFMSKNTQNRVVGGISIYDNIFKKLCEDEGYDWRFLSAIAYKESRFNAHVVSPKGAKGLMQIMPRVARSLMGSDKDLLVPENNILMAIKVLSKIESSLDFADTASDNDKLQILLACYNAGLGHVLDARNLARKYGANPDSWQDVSRYLSYKSDPTYHKDEVVKCGKFNSRETTDFVGKVMNKYIAYCAGVPK